MQYQIVSGLRFGKRFILNGNWSRSYVNLFRKEGIEELAIGNTYGVDRSSLSFLSEVSHIKSFVLTDAFVKDISGIHCLRELRSIHMGDYSKQPIDFTLFPFLDDCYMEFAKGRESIAHCPRLVKLAVQHYGIKDLAVLKPLQGLTSLWFSQGSLGDISDIGVFTNLRDLNLMLLRNLRDVASLKALKVIENLDLQCCKGVDRLDSLSNLTSLRTLNIVDCGEIESLAPLESCVNLEELYFGGETKIVDGNLRVLLRMPHLKKVLFRDRKTYNLRGEDIPAYC